MGVHILPLFETSNTGAHTIPRSAFNADFSPIARTTISLKVVHKQIHGPSPASGVGCEQISLHIPIPSSISKLSRDLSRGCMYQQKVLVNTSDELIYFD